MSEHKSSGDQPRDIGLKAVREARQERGRVKHGRISGRTWLIAIGSVITVIVIAWQFREGTLSRQKEETLSKQRAAVTTVGAEWFPLRDKIEKVVVDAAGSNYAGDAIDPEASKWDFRGAAGIYLRLRASDATTVDAIRKAAKDSGRDSFVGCLLRENNPSMAAMARGEADAGTGWADQPWNLRLAYGATRVLSDEWAQEVKDSQDEIHLRVFVQQYEKAKSEEIPLAIEIIKRAQFFLLALDEDVADAKDLAPTAGRNAGKVSEKELQQVAHPTRVHILKIDKGVLGKEMVRVRREGDADFRFAGEHIVRDPNVLAAMKRQVNNCSLAQNVWAAIRPPAQDTATDAGTSGDAAK